MYVALVVNTRVMHINTIPSYLKTFQPKHFSQKKKKKKPSWTKKTQSKKTVVDKLR